MRFHVLGPVRVTERGTSAALGGPNQRLVLALLVAGVGHTVSTARLIDGVWGDEPPDSARKTLQGHIHRLRAVVGDAIETDPAGYRLAVDPSSVDAVEFESLLAAGRAQEEPAAASRAIAEALALWSGQPYEDLDGTPALEAEIVRLRELRAVAVEDRIEADLALGASTHVIAELESLTREFPLRERLRRLHILALYQAGRQADALAAYQRTRRHLAEELGLDPSPELQRLHEQVLTQDPALDTWPKPADGTRPHSLRGYELREVVGSGAIGTVHRAYQTSVGREVALKVIDAEIADDPAFIQRFAEETRRIAALEHPHIVGLRDAWREPGAAYHVLTWLDGGNLRQRLPADGLAPAAALRLLDGIGAALAYAHRTGTAHGRVKPTNVLFDSDDRACLSDFAVRGTVSRIGSTDDAEYAAPEIRAGGGGPHLPGSDVYSLAVLAHELLTGARPAGDPTDPGAAGHEVELSDTLDAAVVGHLRRALHPDPGRRHAKVEDLLRGLRQAAGVDVGPLATPPPPRSELRNPFKGLRAFQEPDAPDFFGRDDLVERLRTMVRQRRFVAVVGPSGIGKSSVVKAGLLPTLATPRDDGPVTLVTEMFPGSHPFEELRAALLRIAVERPSGIVAELTADDRGLLRVTKQILPDDAEAVLVIDQFEELFSLVTDDATRGLFLANLVTAVEDERARVRVIVTMRADFYDRPLEYADFGRVFEAGTLPVRMPSDERLAQAVAGPARAVGLDLEPGLVSEIVHDVSDQPGGLPLLQYALTELFDQRESDQLTIAAYRRTGGVLGALGTRAERLWQDLGPTGREAIRQVFLRLVTVDEAADDMRRRVRRSELTSLDVPQRELDDAITLFGAHRLLSFDRDPLTRGPTIEVAHEALLREWTRLRHWIEARRGDLVLHRRLSVAVAEWDAARRDASYLLRGDRLAQFESWTAASDITLTRTEAAYLDESRTLRDVEAERERRTTRRLRAMLVGVSLLAVVAALAGAIAAGQTRRARDEAEAAVVSRESAETRRLALQAPQVGDTNRRVALLLAVEAWRRDPSPTSLGALQQVLANTSGFLGYVAVGRPHEQLAFASDDELVAVRPGGVDVLAAGSGVVRRTIAATNAHMIAVAPTSGQIAIAEGAAVRLVDHATGRTLAELDGSSTSPVTAVAFDAAGARLAVGHADGAAAIHDTATGRSTMTIPDAHFEARHAALRVRVHQPGLAQFGTRAIALSDDGSRLATGGLVMARVWDAVTGAQLDEVMFSRRRTEGPRVPAPVRAVAFADGGEVLRIASSFNVVDHPVGGGAPLVEREFPDRIGAVGLAGVDAEVVLTQRYALLAQSGGRLIVQSLETGDAPVIFEPQLSGTPSVALAPDDTTVAVGGDEGVSLWSIDGRGLIVRPLPRSEHSDMTLSTDGRWLSISSADERPPDLFDLSRDEPRPVALPARPLTHYGLVGDMDGIVTWDFRDDHIRYRAFDRLASDGTLLGTGTVIALAYSPVNDLLAIGDGPPENRAVARVFELDTGEQVTAELSDLLPPEPDAATSLHSLSFSTDGRRLAAATNDGAAVVWDTATWDVVARISQGGGQVAIVEYTPDGRFLVTMSSDGQILLRDPETLQQVGGPLLGQTNALTIVSASGFTPDGRYMVTTADGNARLWDLRARVLVGQAFPNDPGTSPSVSRDGRRLGTFVGDQVLVWNLDIAAWDEIACRAAGRNLTRSEWEQFGPADAPYRSTCDAWPAQPARTQDQGGSDG